MKQYSEEQFQFYSQCLEEIANETNLIKNMDLNFELKDWLHTNQISRTAIQLMDKRLKSNFKKSHLRVMK